MTSRSQAASGEVRERDDDGPRAEAWQRRLLPLLVRILVGLTIFFFVITLGQLVYLHRHLQNEPAGALDSFEALTASGQIAELDASVVLETDIIRRRYRMASTLMMAQVWIRYMGFVTGMIMAIIGSAFVLAKFREPPAEFSAEGSVAKVSIMTASPGILLALFGSILMLATILTKQETSVRDVATYVAGPARSENRSGEEIGDSIRAETPATGDQ